MQGLNSQLAAVLLSIGVYAYIENGNDVVPRMVSVYTIVYAICMHGLPY